MVDSIPNAQKLIEKEDSVLIVIDLQDKLLPFIAHREKIVNNIVKLIKVAKIMNIPIIVTEQNKLGPTTKKIADELSDIDIITKVFYSCFGNQAFKQCLKETEKNNLIITGMETHICVMQTVLQALPDYNVHVISDAVSSRYVNNWTEGLERMRDSGAVISTMEMVTFELLKRAGTHDFRVILPLMR